MGLGYSYLRQGGQSVCLIVLQIPIVVRQGGNGKYVLIVLFSSACRLSCACCLSQQVSSNQYKLVKTKIRRNTLFSQGRKDCSSKKTFRKSLISSKMAKLQQKLRTLSSSKSGPPNLQPYSACSNLPFSGGALHSSWKDGDSAEHSSLQEPSPTLSEGKGRYFRQRRFQLQKKPFPTPPQCGRKHFTQK